MSSEIVKNQAGELALPANLQGGAMLEGSEASLGISRLSMYTGTTEEQAKYQGLDLKPGDLVDVLELRKVASRVIVPIGGTISYMKWPQGSRVPEYVYDDIKLVPPADLVWENNKRAVSRCINAVILVQGESRPYVLIFKRTAEKCGDSMFQLEASRGMMRKGRGQYTIATTPKQNANKQTYNQMTIRPTGDAPADMQDLIAMCVAGLEEYKRRASAAAKAEAMKTEDETDAPF